MRSAPQLLELSKQLHDVIQHNLLLVRGTPDPSNQLPMAPGTLVTGERLRNPCTGGLFNVIHEAHEVLVAARGAVYDTESTLRPAPSGRGDVAKEMQPYQTMPLLAAMADDLQDIHRSLVYQKEVLLGKSETPTVGEEMLVGYSKFTEESADTLFTYCAEALEKCLTVARAVESYVAETMKDCARDPVCAQSAE